MDRIKLEEGEFFRLVAEMRLVEVVRHEARIEAVRIAEEHVARRVTEAGKKGAALFELIATKYGFDPKVGVRFDESTCELIPQITKEP